jgi:hypothetical protein
VVAIELAQASGGVPHVRSRAPDAGEIVPGTIAERFVFQQGLGVQRDRGEGDFDVVCDGAGRLACGTLPFRIHQWVAGFGDIHREASEMLAKH